MCANPALIFALRNSASKLYTYFTHCIPYPIKPKYKWKKSLYTYIIKFS